MGTRPPDTTKTAHPLFSSASRLVSMARSRKTHMAPTCSVRLHFVQMCSPRFVAEAREYCSPYHCPLSSSQESRNPFFIPPLLELLPLGRLLLEGRTRVDAVAAVGGWLGSRRIVSKMARNSSGLAEPRTEWPPVPLPNGPPFVAGPLKWKNGIEWMFFCPTVSR